MPWTTNGLLTDPSAGDLLADTGVLSAGFMSFTLMVYTNGGVVFDLVQRNALNTADIGSQRLSIINTGNLHAQSIPLTLSLNQRVVIRNVNDVTGNVQASILW